MAYNIEPKHDPSKEDIAVLMDGLHQEAFKAKGLKPSESFAFFVRDENNKIVAGVSGVSDFGCQHIDLLWVVPDLRGQGWGTKLMKLSEDFGRERKCSFATVNTMDWEALPFYQKLGFSVEFMRDGYDKGSKFYFLRKSL